METLREIIRAVRRTVKVERPFAGVYPAFWKVPEQTAFTSSKYAAKLRERAMAARAAGSLDRDILGGPQALKVLLPTVAAMLRRNGEMLRILDFGGGAGNDANLLSGLPGLNFSYHVVDLVPVIAVGREVWTDDPRVTFSTELPAGPEFDLVYAWSAIHYVDEPMALLDSFAAYNSGGGPSRLPSGR